MQESGKQVVLHKSLFKLAGWSKFNYLSNPSRNFKKGVTREILNQKISNQ